VKGLDDDRKYDYLTFDDVAEHLMVRIVNFNHYNVDEVFSRHRQNRTGPSFVPAGN
jgi:hypothetical protein